MAEYHQQEDPLLLSLEDSLYCEEEHWEEEDQITIRPDLVLFGGGTEEVVVVGEEDEVENHYSTGNCVRLQSINHIFSTTNNINNNYNNEDESGTTTTSSSTTTTIKTQICDHHQDISSFWDWEHHELTSLFTGENQLHDQNHHLYSTTLSTDSSSFSTIRQESVEWMVRVCNHYSFSILTASLAVNYFDKFLYRFSIHNDKPWMSQLASVACLSLAAKMEETHVPLLLDLQVGETKYVFEAKTIQRMEILVLSTLEWRMSSVTAYSFLDYLVRRMMGLTTSLCGEFLLMCEKLLLATLPDCRFLCYPPSVVAAATMLYVLYTLEPSSDSKDKFRDELLLILGTHKDKLISDCGVLITELVLEGNLHFNFRSNNKRRKPISSSSSPSSPNGVIDVSFSSDTSNDSWVVSSSTSSSVSSSPERLTKKMRTDDVPDFQLWRRFSNHPSVV